MKVKKMVTMSLLIAMGFVLSPILRVPGMAPMQHFINVITSVLLGPWYSLFGACAIAFLRMTIMGINLLAVTGAVFGAVLSGLLYRKFHSIFAAVIGEIIGTGVIGALTSYPVMKFVYGNGEVALFTYIPSFIAGTVIGGMCAYLFLKALQKGGLLDQFKKGLEDKPEKPEPEKSREQPAVACQAEDPESREVLKNRT